MRASTRLLVVAGLFVLVTPLGVSPANGDDYPSVPLDSSTSTVPVFAPGKHTSERAADFRHTPRFTMVGWTKAPGNIGIGALRKVVGGHTVVVVPQTVGSPKTSKAQQRRVLSEVAEFWKQQVPGMSVRFILKKPVKVPSSHCSNGSLALSTARRAAGSFDPYKQFNHLAAVVDCGINVGYADLRAGSGTIFVNGWSADTLAHEFGHNLNLFHANVIHCRNWSQPAPRVCDQREYEDQMDVMGGGGIVPLSDRGVYGLWRAWLIGAQRVPAKPTSSVTLTRSGNAGKALPLAVTTSIGPVFVDYPREPESPGYTRDCPTQGIEMRVATNDGGGEFAGQGVLAMVTLTGQETVQADVLDSFVIPGTNKRILVTSRDTNRATIQVFPASDKARPAAPDLSTFPEGPVLLTEVNRTSPWALASLTFPRSPGILGYQVRVDGSCVERVVPGQETPLPLEEGANTLKITPVGLNGVPGTPIIKTVTAATLRIGIPEDTYQDEGNPTALSWSVPTNQPRTFLDSITGFEIRTTYEDEIMARLPSDARSWDPWPTVMQTVEPDDCGNFDVVALSGRGVIGRAGTFIVCRGQW